MLYADVYTAAGQRLGPGPITSVQSVSVQRVMDGVDSVTLTLSGADARADLLQHGRRVRVYSEEYGQTREVARMIVTNDPWTLDPAGMMLSVDGPADMEELKYVSLWTGYTYGASGGDTLRDVLNEIVGFVDGWDVKVQSTQQDRLITGRFDRVSVFGAIKAICERHDLHFRQVAGEKTVEVGTLGANSGVRLAHRDGADRDWYARRDVLPVTSVTITGESEGIVNEIEVLGAGEAEAALTLQGYTPRAGDTYSVSSWTLNGRTVYGIRAGGSVQKFGVRQKSVQFDITPLNASAAATQLAQNALMDAATGYLRRRKDKRTMYEVTLPRPGVTIQAGDRVYLDVDATIEVRSSEFQRRRYSPRRVSGLFWVIEASEDVGAAGGSVMLSLSDVDASLEDPAQQVVDVMSEVEVQQVIVKPALNHYWFGPDLLIIDSSNSATMAFPVGDYTQKIIQATLWVLTRPFTSTSQAGAHRHLMFESQGLTSAYANFYRLRASADGATTAFGNPTTTADLVVRGFLGAGDPGDIYTYGQEAETVYAVRRDTEYPEDITITVNNTTVATGLAPSGGALATSIDVTGEINNKAGGISGIHDIDVECAAGQGEAILRLDIVEQIIPVRT